MTDRTSDHFSRIIQRWIPACAGMMLLLEVVFLSAMAYAADAPVKSTPLENCLKRADDLPDIAAAEATAWIKQKGGNDAHLCRAFAQSNRGMHVDAAREFWFLASYYDKHERHQGVLMHNLAGQEFLRGKDVKNAEAQYNDALKKEPANAASLIGRAKTRMAQEKYWDALDDLNKVINANPDDVDALRQRGTAWMQLGNEKNAEEDFEDVETLTEPPPPK